VDVDSSSSGQLAWSEGWRPLGVQSAFSMCIKCALTVALA